MDSLYIPAMDRIDLKQPAIRPAPLTGIHINPQTKEPMVQIQVLGTLPFGVLVKKADNDSLKRIINLAIDELRARGDKW